MRLSQRYIPTPVPVRLGLFILVACATVLAPTLAAAGQQATNSRTVAQVAAKAPIVVIMLENKTYGPQDPGVGGKAFKYIVGNTKVAPYINKTLIPQGLVFTNYHGAPSSMRDYLDLTAGTSLCGPGGTGSYCRFGAVGTDPNPSLFNLLGQAGISFRSYMQSMPTNCFGTNSGLYDPGHNPEVYFADVANTTGVSYDCGQTDVPEPTSWPTVLPSFSLVTPDLCHDMHGQTAKGPCQINTNAVLTAGDTWLADNVPTLLNRGAIVIVTWDEAATGDGSTEHIPTIMAGPGVTPHTASAVNYTHFGLLAGLENYFGLTPMLGSAITATPVPIP